jgi:hypothetical protein
VVPAVQRRNNNCAMICTQGDLDRRVMYELIQSHGKTDVYLFFAGLVKDYGRVIEHWVTEGKWSQAIDVLNRQVSPLPNYQGVSGC